MVIVERNIDELIPYSQNAKKHDERQIRNVANSIKRFGWRQPVVVDNDGVIVIGHCRVLAAKELGLDKVPVTVADDLTEDEIKELRIADNKTNESPWDFGKLEEELATLSIAGFDMEQFGFDDVDLMGGPAQPIENTSREYGEEDFGDDKFECECPRCGFKFNK